MRRASTDASSSAEFEGTMGSSVAFPGDLPAKILHDSLAGTKVDSMWKMTRIIVLLAIVCMVLGALVGYSTGWFNPAFVQALVRSAGLWAPLLYVALYVVATSLLLPSTPLNISGGVLFGLWFGMLWTGIAAIVAATVLFAFTRTLGQRSVGRKIGARWPAIDTEARKGAKSYMFAVRLLPIIPNGLINYGAGISSISFKDYMIGSVPGTLLGILPPVLIGSSGVKAMRTGDVIPVITAMALMGLLIVGATWYRHRRGIAGLSEG
jgi:uncharacterized membrane protein YdjX (TVP38/TMEM64 family)